MLKNTKFGNAHSFNKILKHDFTFQKCILQLFSRVCGGAPGVLDATSAMAERAASVDPTSSACMAEVGRQCLLRGKVKEAHR